MQQILKLSNSRKNILFETVAREMQVSTTIIEKDFWVCVVLNYLLNESKYKDYFIFKGGTSLSKCYDVIKRFSEDVDLILKWDKIGFSDSEVYEARSKNKDNKFEILMNEKGSIFIQNELKQDLIENFANKINGIFIENSDVDSMILNIKYPTMSKDDYIAPSIKLEIGPVAAKTPTEIRYIEPYCYKSFNVSNKEPFKVEIVSIERTFWEKVLILYAERNRPIEKRMPLRYSRHYYDVYMIYKSNYFSRVLNNIALFEEVKRFKSKYYRSSWSNLEECSFQNLYIIPNQERIIEVASDYEKMKDMIFANRPSFNELMEGLQELENKLLKLNLNK